jgi:hypothetical protein
MVVRCALTEESGGRLIDKVVGKYGRLRGRGKIPIMNWRWWIGSDRLVLAAVNAGDGAVAGRGN